MNINDLTHEQLNTLAALGQGWDIKAMAKDRRLYEEVGDTSIPYNKYDPCNNGGQAMELVERYGRDIERGLWFWLGTHAEEFFGLENKKLAITKAFVASVYGTEIDFEKIVGDGE